MTQSTERSDGAMLQGLTDNLTTIFRLVPKHALKPDTGPRLSTGCSLCRYVVAQWPHIVLSVQGRQSRFLRHLGCVVIPHDTREGEVAYLSLSEPYTVEIKPYDSERLKAEAEPPQGATNALKEVAVPSLPQKAKNFAGAMIDWAKCGFKLVDDTVLAERKAICIACEFWQGDGYMGAGKCSKCGCSGVKLKLASSNCPIGKWRAINNCSGAARVPPAVQPTGSVPAGDRARPEVQPGVPGAAGCSSSPPPSAR